MTNIQAINLLKGLEQSLDDYCELNDEGKTAFGMAIAALELFGNSERLPSAQPERKKGEWIEVDDHYNRISGRCSVCGWEALLYETDVVGMDFCPNCGADMRGEQK